MRQILITTTPTLNNAKVLQYCDIVTNNVVIGANLFSDFMASLSDVFGGHSETYQRKLEGIYQEVINGLKLKAMQKSANAILGLHIDFDEITGKGKQMFMVSAVGTACKMEFLDNPQSHQAKANKVSDAEVVRLCMLRNIQKKLQKYGWIPDTQTWEYMLTHKMPELAVSVAAHYFTISDPYNKKYMENLIYYLSTLTYDETVNALYPLLEDHPEEILPLIKEQKLFHPQKVLSLIEKGNLQVGMQLLISSKEYYNQNDLNLMEDILNKLDNLPEKGRFEKIVSSLFNKKEKERYICPNGHKNNKDYEYCVECGLNIKGLNINDVKKIEDFRDKVNALKDIMIEKTGGVANDNTL